MIIQQEVTSARVQALIVTIGLFTFVGVGVAACLALVAGLFYLAVSLVLLVLQATISAFGEIAGLWVGAHPVLKCVLLVVLAYGAYRFSCHKIHV